jgi:hypothetical protein
MSDVLEELSKELSRRLAVTLDKLVQTTSWICCCGRNPAVEQIGKFALCESCKFRFLVMRAAGREKEFARRMKSGI